MTQLVECIPNFSEARRPQVVDEIATTISSSPGVSLLHKSSDLDHNRTVLTFAGAPEAVEEAAFRAIERAARLIDLNEHRGEHPRIGATDVVPFVPLSGSTMEDCVALARRLGKRVGESLQIPVYLYEFAATSPDRTNLEDIRRGQFEGLREQIKTDPSRMPDFGPALLGPAGATVIGARNALIAFNVYLSTSEVEVARKIAKAIRHSSGGMRFVKALGLLVEGRAQVSINLTNYRETPIGRVVELIRREAARYGVSIHHSELVGLIPQDALVDAAVWYTQLDGFSAEQILETKLYASLIQDASSATHESFIEQVSAATAAPGGGSVAAHAAALGAGLVEMVAGLTIGKTKYKNVEPEMRVLLLEVRDLRTILTEAVAEDAKAYEAVMEAYRLPKDTEAQKAKRDVAVQKAMLSAARVPSETAAAAVRVLELAARCVAQANVNAISDALSGAAMARAALTAAGYNVRINLYDHPDKVSSEALLSTLTELEARADAIEAGIRREVQARAKLA
jgi:glutamate formiminotransferase / formiminotetrahydrofolate cyclodeaminase